jgi:hypothetical protein
VRRAVALVAFLALAAPAPALAQVEDPPDELWRDFPLTTRTEAPPAVPPAQPAVTAAAEPAGVGTDEAGGGDGGPWWILAAGAGVAALAGGVVLRGRGRALPQPVVAAPAVPDRTVVSVERARIARRGGGRDVVAAVAPAPAATVYEVVWRFDGERSGFGLAAVDDDARPIELPRSRPSAWRVPGPPPSVASLRAVHEEFCDALVGSGWTPAGDGDTWYGRRFLAPMSVGQRASNVRPSRSG